MTKADDRFVRRMMERITRLGFNRAFSAIPIKSKHLRSELEIQIVSMYLARLYLDPYYAIWVHDGSGPMDRTDSSLPPFVWFKNPKLDPRLNGGKTPNRFANYPVRALTPKEFRTFRKANQLWITRSVKKRTGNPFFSNGPGGGMRGFRQDVGNTIPQAFSEHIKQALGEDYRDTEIIG